MGGGGGARGGGGGGGGQRAKYLLPTYHVAAFVILFNLRFSLI